MERNVPFGWIVRLGYVNCGNAAQYVDTVDYIEWQGTVRLSDRKEGDHDSDAVVGTDRGTARCDPVPQGGGGSGLRVRVLVAVSACSPLRDLQGAVHVAYTTVPVVAAMALFTWCSSLRDGPAGRVIAAVAGALSLACAVGQSLGALFFPVRATGAEGTEPVGFYPQETWAAGVVGLLWRWCWSRSRGRWRVRTGRI